MYHTLSFSFCNYFSFLYQFFSFNWGFSSIFQGNITNFIYPYIINSFILGFSALFSAFFIGVLFSLLALQFEIFGKYLQIICLATPITIWGIIFSSFITTSHNVEYYTCYNFFLALIIITLYHSNSIVQMNILFFREEISKPYYQLLLKKNKHYQLFLRYLIKPNIIQILDNLSLKICILLGGSIGIEIFFHIPGVGSLVRKSIIQNDPQLLLISSFCTLFFVMIGYYILDIALFTIKTLNKEVVK